MQFPAPAAPTLPETTLPPIAEPEPRLQPLRPPGPHRILVGTSGWQHPSLIACGRFYPPGCRSAADRLRHYGSRFSLLELDDTHLHWPQADEMQALADAAPAGLVINVRAFGLCCGHPTAVDALPMTLRAALGAFTQRDVQPGDLSPALQDLLWDSFMQALQPLQAAGLLGALHLRMAPGFVAGADSRARLDEVRARLMDRTIALQFDDPGWLHPAEALTTLEFEKERGLVNVVVDGRRHGIHGAAAHWEVTHPQLAVVRVVGQPDDPELTDAELENLAMDIRKLAERVLDTHVVVDHPLHDRAQQQAARLQRWLAPGR